MISDAIKQVIEHQNLDRETMETAMETVLTGGATDAQIAAFAVALRMKGETPQEIAAAARIMRSQCQQVRIDVTGPILDTCGTGGDGAGTFNVSTAAAVVAAACGATVAKHGNRAVSSQAGSADVLEALGIEVTLSAEAVADCIERFGIGFLFAPLFHGALRHAASARRQLGIRTIFNLLGPLTNPAGATHQLLGVYDVRLVPPLAEVLRLLGVKGAWIVHGHGGIDEVSPSGPTEIAELVDGRITIKTLEPADFGLDPIALGSIKGGDASVNAAILRSVLEGETGPFRNAVIINSAAALCASGIADKPKDGVRRTSEAIDSGAALRKLDEWAVASRRLATEPHHR